MHSLVFTSHFSHHGPRALLITASPQSRCRANGSWVLAEAHRDEPPHVHKEAAREHPWRHFSVFLIVNVIVSHLFDTSSDVAEGEGGAAAGGVVVGVAGAALVRKPSSTWLDVWYVKTQSPATFCVDTCP